MITSSLTSNPDFTEFFSGYLRALLFVSMDEEDAPLSRKFSESDFEDDSIEVLSIHAQSFFLQAAPFIKEAIKHDSEELSYGKAGTDFLLTSAGHGAGFWDGDWATPGGDFGPSLTSLSKNYPEFDVYVTNDGKLSIL